MKPASCQVLFALDLAFGKENRHQRQNSKTVDDMKASKTFLINYLTIFCRYLDIYLIYKCSEQEKKTELTNSASFNLSRFQHILAYLFYEKILSNCLLFCCNRRETHPCFYSTERLEMSQTFSH
jgi:hypothetical protein